MGRFLDMVGFIEREAVSPRYIEPAERQERLIENLADIIATYNPGVIVKAGIGSGPILLAVAAKTPGRLYVVEPSAARIEGFLADHRDNELLQRISFIQGDFAGFPIDYYKVDLLLCIDYLDFLDSARAIDEFRRAIQIDGILVVGMVVLHDDDLEGVYDDFMRALLPLHNDFYLQEDLKTVLDLNGFTFVKGAALKHAVSLEERMAQGIPPSVAGALTPGEILTGHAEEFERLYGFQGGRINEPYFLGVFRRRKPDQGSTL